MVAGEGFEPSKAEPGDLQSPPIGRSGNPPGLYWTCGNYGLCEVKGYRKHVSADTAFYRMKEGLIHGIR